MKLATTLRRIRECGPCRSGWEKVLAHRGGVSADLDAEFDVLEILESNGYADTVWALRAVCQDPKTACVHVAYEIARAAPPIYEAVGTSSAPREALEIVGQYLLDGFIDPDAAARAADAAARAAEAAARAAEAAAEAADVAAYAAYAAAYAAYAAAEAAHASYASYATYAAAHAGIDVSAILRGGGVLS